MNKLARIIMALGLAVPIAACEMQEEEPGPAEAREEILEEAPEENAGEVPPEEALEAQEEVTEETEELREETIEP